MSGTVTVYRAKSWGGRRPNSGIKRGTKKGPRLPEGILSKEHLPQTARQKHLAVLESIRGSADDPLLNAVAIYRDEERYPVAVRLQAISIAVKYCYPQLTAMQLEVNQSQGGSDQNALTERLLGRLEALSHPGRTVDAVEEKTPSEPLQPPGNGCAAGCNANSADTYQEQKANNK